MASNLSATAIPSPPATAKLLSLVAEQRKQSKDDGSTITLRSLGIAETLPSEVIEVIKDEVSRYSCHLSNFLTLDLILDRISYFILTLTLGCCPV